MAVGACCMIVKEEPESGLQFVKLQFAKNRSVAWAEALVTLSVGWKKNLERGEHGTSTSSLHDGFRV